MAQLGTILQLEVRIVGYRWTSRRTNKEIHCCQPWNSYIRPN